MYPLLDGREELGEFLISDGKYSIDTSAKVSILRYPSENPHHELHIHKLVMYFDFQNFEFFRFLQHLPRFPVIFILDFFLPFLVTIPATIPSRYSTIPKGIAVSILFHNTIAYALWTFDYSESSHQWADRGCASMK